MRKTTLFYLPVFSLSLFWWKIQFQNPILMHQTHTHTNTSERSTWIKEFNLILISKNILFFFFFASIQFNFQADAILVSLPLLYSSIHPSIGIGAQKKWKKQKMLCIVCMYGTLWNIKFGVFPEHRENNARYILCVLVGKQFFLFDYNILSFLFVEFCVYIFFFHHHLLILFYSILLFCLVLCVVFVFGCLFCS